MAKQQFIYSNTMEETAMKEKELSQCATAQASAQAGCSALFNISSISTQLSPSLAMNSTSSALTSSTLTSIQPSINLTNQTSTQLATSSLTQLPISPINSSSLITRFSSK